MRSSWIARGMHNDFSLALAKEKGSHPVMRSRAIRRPATVRKKTPIVRPGSRVQVDLVHLFAGGENDVMQVVAEASPATVVIDKTLAATVPIE